MSRETSDLWRTVATWLFALLQAGMIFLLVDIRNTMREQSTTLAAHSSLLAVMQARHDREDRRP